MSRALRAAVFVIIGAAVVALLVVNAHRDEVSPPNEQAGRNEVTAEPGERSGDTSGEVGVTSTEGSEGDEAETAALPRMVDLGADKCVPCKMMAPVLADMKQVYAGRLQVDFIDVWKDPSAGKQYDVKVIPTQIFYDGRGNELFRHQGFFSREDILAKWRELGYEFES
jgi:thioredoxin 1